MAAPGFWNDPERARGVVDDVRRLRRWTEPFEDLTRRLQDAQELAAMVALEPDADLEQGLFEEAERLRVGVEALELQGMLQGPDDRRDALLTVHPGAGGTESQDWAEMLMRMYSRWGERRGYDVQILDLVAGEEAGIKSVAMEIRGDYAYGFLKAEKGVHRLVRISPFDGQSRRHTSFASVFVFPEIDDTIEVEIDEKDLRIDTYRASGAGGQHVNKTSSAVRITHLPSNIVVQCQNERSQHRNKDTAMKMLKARLYQREMDMQAEQQQELRGEKMEIAWGSQIRSYVLQPYQMIKDHRTEHEVGNVDSVLDGNLDSFLTAYLLWEGRS